ncbi:T9SS type A sorting domain-containing protein [Flavobacterium sp.]|uniref:T9SS type A sorting domain-containing protein n=1 Tax=Flavobacterium sp. TaxID=239 RepID=UPI0039E63FF6
MKKIYTLICIGLATLTHAQVPNADFEQALGYGQTNVWGWGQLFILPVSMDLETGESTSDSILFEEASLGGFCTSTTDAHTGQRAMMIRNAFNITQNEVIPGKADLFNTEISEQPSGWNVGVPVEANAEIDQLSFWYKFSPIGNDVAEAKLELLNENNQPIGTARILISEATETYTYASVPLTLDANGAPAFLTISFSMAAEGSEPAFGSSLTVDDLKVNNTALQTAQFATAPFSIYPTVADQEINLRSNQGGHYTISLVNMQGRVVAQYNKTLQNGIASPIDVGPLATGVYLVKAFGNNTSTTAKFIKK